MTNRSVLRMRGLVAAVAVMLACSACGLRITDAKARDAIQPTTVATVYATVSAQAGGNGPVGTSSAPVGASSGATLSNGGPTTGATLPAGPGGGGTAGGGTTSVTPTQHCTGVKSTINIGTVGEQSGVFAPFLYPGVQAMQAWIAKTNAAGGINCHPIKYIVKDDGGDPSQSQAEVQELVTQDHIAAMVYMDSPIAGQATVSYLAAHGIPVIGSEGGSDWFYESPNYFPQITGAVTGLATLITVIARIGAPSHKTTLGAISCLEVPLCSSVYTLAPKLAKDNHLKLAYNGQASITQPNFTSSCQAAQAAHVDLFVLGMDTNSIERVLSNCASINYHPYFISGGALIAPSLIADPNAEGMYLGSFTAPYTDTSNSQIAAMTQTLRQYAPGVPPSIDAAAGWSSALLFQIAVEKATAPTPAGLMAALDTLHNEDLDGLTYPMTFHAGKNAPRTVCFWYGEIHHKTLVTPAGLPSGRVCSA